jgi:hypothetical protein
MAGARVQFAPARKQRARGATRRASFSRGARFQRPFAAHIG